MALRLSSKLIKSFLTVESLHCNNRLLSNLGSTTLSKLNKSTLCPRICPLYHYQSQTYSTDVNLRDYLKEEIEAEKEVAKKHLGVQSAPTIGGFQIKADEADVTLTKTFNSEKITVSFNVNDCVRPREEIETGTMENYEQQEGKEPVPILAEPSFRVEIEKNSQKLVFECDIVPEYAEETPSESQQEEESDLFNINAVYLTTGEVTDKVYGASGEILDGTFYDHLFQYLAERGIDNKFADELVRFATHYEHAQYVNLLQKLREFVSK